MKVIHMYKFEENSNNKIVAYFDLQTPDGVILKGFKVVNGVKGLFVSVPSEKGKDEKYHETVILPKEMKSELEKIALEEYQKK